MKKITDEYIKKKLNGRGLNPENSSFLDDPRYEEIKKEKMITKYGSVTLDYYIRKEWFPEQDVTREKGRFSPQAEWDGNPMEANDLITEIRLETIEELKDSSRDDERIYDDANIKNKLFGTSGLRENLKHRVGFDTSLYRQGQVFEELKLLKILYRIEKHHSEKVNITKLLGDLSLENVDRSIIGEKSVHGLAVTELLTEVHLAIDPMFPFIANQLIIDLTHAWNEKLLQISNITRMDLPKEIRVAELQRILGYITLLLDRVNEPKLASYNNLLESFYLRVLQLKQIARTHDIDRVTNFIAVSKQTDDLKNQEAMFNPFPPLVTGELREFIDRHIHTIASLVYPGVLITEKHRQFLRKQVTVIPELLAVYNKQKVGEKQSMTTIFLISCLQEIALSHSMGEGDDEYAFKNIYYLADGKHRTLTSILKKMTKQLNVEEVFQLIWTIKLERRINTNLGRLDEYLLLLEIGEKCNQMINKMLQVPDFITMKVWSEFLLSQVIVNETYPIVLVAGQFENHLKQTFGFSCELKTLRLFTYFTDEHISSEITKAIFREVDIMMNKPKVSLEDVRLMRLDMNGEIFTLAFSIDTMLKRFIMRFFMPEISDEESSLQVKVGLEKFVTRTPDDFAARAVKQLNTD